MKAVGAFAFGGPEVLRVVDVPEPHAGPGEVRIRVHAAAVNPSDTLIRAGLVPLPGVRPPYIPGQDAAGVVDQIGEGTVTGLRIGDRVMAMVIPIGPRGGAYAEHVVLPESWVTRAPAGTGHVEAATLPMNGLTARMTLDLLDLPPGGTLAVTGAAGTFGGYTVQMAKAEGLRVIADASPADEELVRALGADLVVARGDDVAARIRQAVPEGVDGLADGALIGASVLGAVRDGGGVAALRGTGALGTPERGITFHNVYVPDYGGYHDKLDGLRQMADDGAVTLRVAGVFPPEQAPDAHRLFEAGGVRGRLVIEF
ncbi:zinc-binding alcohol dehydrogenase [Sphaerisporangium melleum]|uniref:Zinc-binding alcohol dehydrogenase n=1 Tax=Sphaerisporangium melleum TaxID=321316 RepID=A0A917RP31_9ACTN|nr:NADP-dependent oxidoreductase [Sphaerisporangium melleum]GGL16774.1 zinc-binding alcohol dehydrogenase [Sphaerisporangium melleum]GII74650.1 zinc-binding alcohol dehydrogenase [Sphaerisporangium melleum]